MTSPKQASTERRATLLHAAARAAKSFASILDFEQMLIQAVEIICEEFGFYYSGVFLVGTERKWAVLTAGKGAAGKAMLAEGHKLEVGGNSMIGDCVANKEARISLDVGEEAVFFKNPHLPKTRSEMGLPLIVGEKVLGALTVQSVEEAAFTQEDISTLQAMADQLAVAIENARLHQNAERRAKYFKAANQVGHTLASILNLEKLLPQTVDVICDVYNFYYAGVFLNDEDNQWAILRAGRGEAGKAMLAAGHKLEIGGNSMIGDCIAKKEASISLDVGEEAVFFKNPHLPETRSEMGLPLKVGDEVLGAVTVQSTEEAAFNAEDISTLQTMADHLAIAIKNANTLIELEEAHNRILRQKTFEALANATTQAIHWIGNKALPITTTVERMRQDLEEDEIDRDSMREDLGMVALSAHQIVEVKERLLGQAREHMPRPLMISDVASSSAKYIDIPNVNFKISAAPDIPFVLGDSAQLVRVFSELYKNSAEAGASQIEVHVKPITNRKQVQISVKDNGSGIPFDLQGRIWASFVTTKGPSYHGLGLSSCLHIVGQHQGIINMESEEGKSTTFTVVLPSCDTPDPVEGVSSTGSVLLIDDNDQWAKITVETLKKFGKQVTQAANTEGAPQADLILMDDALDENNLGKILDALQQSGASSKTIVLAAGITVERTTHYLKYQVKDVILKPYTEAEIASLITEK
ncbi:GAF domain-containing protein [Chloroflexota bacterium]